MVNKMKFMGKNSIFNLYITIQMNDDSITGIATGTALTLKALPIPRPLEVQINKYTKDSIGNMGSDIEDIKNQNQQNIELNFKMPVFSIVNPEKERASSLERAPTGGRILPKPVPMSKG